MRAKLAFLAILAFAIGCGAAAAQTTSAVVVSACGTPPTTYSAGQNRQVTQDTGGNLCNKSNGGSVTPSPLGVSTIDKGGTITLGGTAQTAIALNTSRKGWCITNDPASTETLYVRVNGTASTTTGIPLSPGQQACNEPGLIDTAAVSVIAATTSHRWFGFEVQ